MSAPSVAGALAKALAPYTCTFCEKQKAENNHWFVIWIEAQKAVDRQLTTVDCVSFTPWSLPMASRTLNAAVACGEACLHKLISRYLSTGLFTAPRSLPSTVDRQLPTDKEPSC
jgi:hypothetical protein